MFNVVSYSDWYFVHAQIFEESKRIEKRWIFFAITFNLRHSLASMIKSMTSLKEFVSEEDVEKMSNESMKMFMATFLYNINEGTGEYRIRYESVVMIAGTVSILLIQYTIMIFCGTSIHLQMNEKLKNFSLTHQRLQKQFFKTLLLQIGVPTVLFHMPIFPVLLAPFFNLKISYQTGIIYSLFCSYPPIDALIIMGVVTDYRAALNKIFGGNHVQDVTATNRTEVLL
ncbi:hypothetical protein CAEBREN_11579 [Caenorhabditis brenneri]|uniref:Uncharacterized protein n=1 Tax=Caenorhabditis brenneri TaxID=135651 RepID=G0NIU1_CAEBE|nr:hypothetical protein CAEBREN_11579 [Caenorhabditis brenneri]